MAVNYQKQTQEFKEAVLPVLESSAQEIHRLFIKAGIIPTNTFAASCFLETGVNDWHNALYCLMDEYKKLIASGEHKTQCILLKSIVEAVIAPVKTYCSAHGIPLDYNTANFRGERARAESRGQTLLTGIEHSLCKNVIGRYNAAIATEKSIQL